MTFAIQAILALAVIDVIYVVALVIYADLRPNGRQ